MRPMCIDCLFYHEIHAPSIEEGGSMPGKGECFFAPPVIVINPASGLIDSVRPSVLGIDFCANYRLHPDYEQENVLLDALQDKLFKWAKRSRQS